ncbi:MAG: phosphonate transport system ATP-binding protein, partial [Oleiphilaceae bacterium]
TVICTLHQVEYAIEFADRIVALRKGRVFFDGHPRDMDAATQEQLYRLTEEAASEVSTPAESKCLDRESVAA